MNSKKIINIVFYKYYNQDDSEKHVCVFYDDGTVENVTCDEGITLCEKVAKDNHITSKNAFVEMINKNIVHVVSGKYLEENFEKYKAQKDIDLEEEITDEDNIEPIIVSETTSDDVSDDSIDDSDSDVNDIETNEEESMFDEDIDDSISSEDAELEDSLDKEIDEVSENRKKENKIVTFFKKQINKIKNSSPVVKLAAIGTALVMTITAASCQNHKTKEGKMLSNNIVTSTFADDILAKNTNKNAENNNNNNKSITANSGTVGDDQVSETTNTDTVKRQLVKGNNDLYDDYTYEELLEVTESKSQKVAMTNLYTTINEFNGEFASHYTEKLKINGKRWTVRPALSFDELVSLQVAYNKYGKTELKAYFNGAEVDSEKMTRAYKDASLQLMGAYVIETKANPLDMSTLIESEEGKAFYAKYHKMFLEAKNATGEEKLNKVKKFYYHVRKDFPVTKEVREEGIAHADSRSSLEDYKLAVTPMIAAAEMLFQNLETDYTLKKTGIKYINDIGLCNYAEEKFDKAEIISFSFEEDNTNPLYIQYRSAIIKIMKSKKQYSISDEHRELTNLKAFQKAINWHFDMIDNAEWSHNGGFYTTSTTRTETETWTETSTSYYEETTYTEKPIPADVQAQIDAQIDAENAEAERRGYEESERERQRLQAEEDAKARRIYEEIEQEERDMEDRINHANDTINNGGTVNESDFGYHDVDFDNNHSDGNGNLDKSVENITTDPTNDQTNQPLPDPNQTGAQFDAQAGNDMPTNNYDYTYNYSEQDDYTTYNSTDNNGYTQTTEESNSGYTQYVDENNYIEFPSGYDYSFNQSAGQTYVEYESQSNEALVDYYINSLSNQQASDEAYQYTR